LMHGTPLGYNHIKKYNMIEKNIMKPLASKVFMWYNMVQ
jgi:hypothetical protein